MHLRLPCRLVAECAGPDYLNNISFGPAFLPAMHGLRAFFAELQKRRVLHTALWYIGGCVAVLQAADLLFLPALGVSKEVMRPLTIIAVFGLPIALTLSWEFDVLAGAQASGDVRRQWQWLLPVTAVSVLSLTFASLLWKRQSAPARLERAAAAVDANPAHVAVLPFTTTSSSSGADLDAFAYSLQMRIIEGLAAAVSTALPVDKRLTVTSLPAIQPFSKPGVTLDSIRNRLKVGTVIHGTVEAVADAVRVRVDMVDTNTGDLLATSVAEKRGRDRIALLDAVADSVLRLVRHQLGPLVRDRTRRMETTNDEAFNAFALGVRRLDDIEPALNASDNARTVLDEADAYFARAERLDPHWIEPIVKRGQIAIIRMQTEAAAGNRNPAIYLAQGMQHVRRALKLRKDDYRALELRGRLRFAAYQSDKLTDKFSFERGAELARGAEADLRRSLSSNPTPGIAYRLLSELASEAGRMEEAVSYARQAYVADPYLEFELQEATLLRLFEYSLALGRDADAEQWCREGRTRYVNVVFDDCRLVLAAWSSYPLTPDSAYTIAEHELAIYHAALRRTLEPKVAALYAAVLARNAMVDSARVTLARARRLDSTSAGALKAYAGVYWLLGSRDSAFLMMRKLLAAHPAQRGVLERSPELRALRSQPTYRRIISAN